MFDRQTKKFCAAVVEALPPNISERVMQVWIDSPRALQDALGLALCAKRWREEGDIIYFSVTSNGMTGEERIVHLEAKDCSISDFGKSVLRSPDFKPTSGVTIEIAVLKGSLFNDSDRITSKIRAFATERKLTAPNAEVACLIRDSFSDEEIKAMGLWWIVAMHEPIKDSDGHPDLLGANRLDGDGRKLRAFCDRPGFRWPRGSGFAFAVSQVGA